MAATTPAALGEDLDRHRAELTGYCYRMLGSPFEAEDAVQETLLRAWRGRGGYDEARASLRTWLYRIATNICLDMLKGRGRRARPVDLGPAAEPGPDIGAPLPERVWVQPIPDSRVLPEEGEGGDPAALAVARETIGLAFVAALQHLSPRQRAVLILRDVLCWRAAEVAELLDMSVAAVNSALQRARAALPARRPAETSPALGAEHAALLARYVAAFERYDVAALVALLREDATMSMPPFAWWLSGRDAIERALAASAGRCAGSRLVPVAANGTVAFGQYLPDGAGGHRRFALLLLDIAGGLVAAMTTYLDDPRLLDLFGLPETLP
ncbi:sigma-70 family RNA polymerase sigma factor [Sphaerisporangium fuscum]|uniref:sigma-70 family RNA polymerase sigma factor n=1 Tax=Sphaerisporangium fuscum TaxID=2835868 RepID=UPI001BDBBC0F|nr:sigma-70 family RNA polymerase sigma factor [Sphaerisporangium fuscum]